MVVAVGADDLDVVAVDADDRGVEGPAAQVVDEDVPHPGLVLVVQHLVVQGGGHWLGEDVEYVQAGDLPGLAGGLALEQPEVGRHGDHHVPDLLAGLLLRGVGQFPQDQCGDRLGGVVLPVERVVNVLAHLPLDQLDDQVRSEHGGIFGLPAHHQRCPATRSRPPRASCPLHRALQDHRPPRSVHVGDTGVGGAKVNSVSSHVTSL